MLVPNCENKRGGPPSANRAQRSRAVNEHLPRAPLPNGMLRWRRNRAIGARAGSLRKDDDGHVRSGQERVEAFEPDAGRFELLFGR